MIVSSGGNASAATHYFSLSSPYLVNGNINSYFCQLYCNSNILFGTNIDAACLWDNGLFHIQPEIHHLHCLGSNIIPDTGAFMFCYGNYNLLNLKFNICPFGFQHNFDLLCLSFKYLIGF